MKHTMRCFICWHLMYISIPSQKMLAHRVAQAYGLQTSTVDYEEGPGRVVGTRTQYTQLRKVDPLPRGNGPYDFKHAPVDVCRSSSPS
jgi:hypothetical protein